MIGTTAVVPVNAQLMVREYDYFTDGVRTGVIFLLDGPKHPPQISWWTKETVLQIPWHGAWFSPTGNPDESSSGNFINGIFAVELIVDHFVGKDYQDRGIILRHRATHTYEGTGLQGECRYHTARPHEFHEY